MTNGFLRVAACSPRVTVADPASNARRIIEEARRLDSLGVEVVVFPEMSVCGYTCADLFHNDTLLQACGSAVETIREATAALSVDLIIGFPQRRDGALYNCAMLLQQGRSSVVAKKYLPDYNEFYERRWFAPGREADSVFESHGAIIGIEICEDLWTAIPPSSHLALEGAQVIFNLSASDDQTGKYSYLKSLIAQQSARCFCGYVYASSGWGESSTDLVFAPKDIIAECGAILAESDRFDTDAPTHCVIADIDIDALQRDRVHTTTFNDCADREHPSRPGMAAPKASSWVPDYEPQYRRVDPHPFVPSDPATMDSRCDEIMFIQQSGLARRMEAIGCKSLTVGISGGLDSTLALLVAVEAFDRLRLPRTGIVGVTMPGFGTTGRTYRNALTLMEKLGVTVREVPIADAVMQHFKDIGHNPEVTDVTYENSQARERTQILMDIANQTGGIVLGTGDLSELALGWATYNGDHMSMYGVNAGVPKTLVRHLVSRFAAKCSDAEVRDVLLDVIATPISPELVPAASDGTIKQKTEDLVGPYELHDFFLYYMLRYGFTPRRIYMLARKAFDGQYDDAVILKWLRTFFRRFFTQQFKRSCLPDGPKVGSVCLSPRGDWRMPSDATVALWLREVDML